MLIPKRSSFLEELFYKLFGKIVTCRMEAPKIAHVKKHSRAAQIHDWIFFK